MNRRRTRWVFAARFAVAFAGFGALGLGYRYGLQRSGRPPFVQVLAATVLVAALLWVLRTRIDRFADRRTYGADADGYREVRDLLARMASSLPVDDVVPALARTLTQRTLSSRAEVRLDLGGGGEWREVWPRQAPSTERHITVPVVHQGEDIGEIDLDGAPPDVEQRSRDILQAVAGPAAVALSTVRLTLALRRRATELMDINDALERSRQRLVDARFEQRRHFRGELEQRVLPPLDAARAAVTAAGGTGRPVDLAPAGAAVESALEALREISRGVYPPRMADAGLVTALRSWRNGAATVVTAGDLDRLHRDPAAEAGAFFAVVSWLQAAHPGSAGPVRVAVDDDRVRFEVSGDVEAGILDEVVEAMRDRTGAFGGELEVQRTVMPMVVSGWLPFAADSRPGRSVPTAPSGELQW